MNDIQVFQDVQFGQVRAIIIKNEPWFIGKDVCATLGYARPDNAVTDRVDEEDRIYVDSKTRPEIKDKIDYRELGQRGGWLINESGLYAVIFGSQLESAKAFKKWVTSKVLPSIRKTGGYGVPQTIPEQIQLLAQGNVELNQRVDDVETRIKDLENTMTLDHGQQYFLEKTVNKTVISALGGKESNAYKQIGRKVFAECNGDLKSYFKVSARGNVPKKKYEEAVAYAEKWKPCMNTQMLIEQYNAQQSFNLEGGVANG